MSSRRSISLLAAFSLALGAVTLSAAGAATRKHSSSIAFSNFSAGFTGGEPSISYDPKSDSVFYAAGTTVKRMRFSLHGGLVSNTDVTPPTSPTTLDTIGVTDPRTGRTFISYLALACSIMAYTDNGGQSWQQSTGCGAGSLLDHQSVGVGPLHAPLAGKLPYDGAVYYCAQNSYNGACSVSLDGGVTFGPGVPVANTPLNLIGDPLGGACSALHGHLRVGPDGTAYLPLKGCGGVPTTNNLTNSEFRGGSPSLSVSEDNGLSWQIRKGPAGSNNPDESDPSVGIGSKGTIYLGWQNGPNNDDTKGGPFTSARVAVSHDHGKTWGKMIDLSTPLGLHNVQFPEMITGDDSRAAFSFIATPTIGNDQDQPFPGEWHLYVSMTYDAGKTWKTVDATPKDPVHRGCVRMTGTTFGTSRRVDNCTLRNMLDFNDVTVDRYGHPLVAYTDACVGPCVNDKDFRVNPGFPGVLKVAILTKGRGLYAKYDKALLSTHASK